MTQRHFPPQRYAEPKPKGLLITGIVVSILGAISAFALLRSGGSFISFIILAIGLVLVFVGTRERRRLPR
jgi:hypothetical protein